MPSRGHRKNLFEAEYKLVGIYAAEHQSFKQVVVLDYSKNFKVGEQGEEDDDEPKADKKKKKEKAEKGEMEGAAKMT